ncbi:MAG: RidA family protein [Alphaproteobacteria bacterium]|nr:RidA family protein [Alphaproteobacteria bacterium]
MSRQLISANSPFEPVIGFSRAVRVGNIIAVSGTAPLDANGKTVAPNDLKAQTRRCLEIMLAAIASAGGRPENVVRTRLMLIDITRWREAAEAHGEVFRDIRPACTFVGVARFIDPEWLVETEADRVLSH